MGSRGGKLLCQFVGVCSTFLLPAFIAGCFSLWLVDGSGVETSDPTRDAGLS